MTANAPGSLEIRTEGGDRVISGRFPYGVETELTPGRMERFEPGAFEVTQSVYLLASHDFNKPLASVKAGSLTVRNDADALAFEARISPDVANTTHGKDTLALLSAGLSAGLSPGFAVLTPHGETVQRKGSHIVRSITRAQLHELSIVTRPAYTTAQVEARNWSPNNPRVYFIPGVSRWR